MSPKFCILIIGTAVLAYAQNPIPTPIPPGPPTLLPDYIGGPAIAQPLPNSRVPQDPFLAPNPFGHVHLDSWMSDTADIAGPLGRDPVVTSTTLPGAHQDPKSWILECIGMVFDSHGRLVLGCAGLNEESIVLADPLSLEVLSVFPLPAQNTTLIGDGAQKYPTTSAVTYNFLDNHDQLTVIARGNHIITLREGGSSDKPVLELVQDYDLSQRVGVQLASVIVDWQGRLWFDTKDSAVVYVFNPAVSKYPYLDVKSVQLDPGEVIANAFAVTKEGAAYVNTSKKMYRVNAGIDDQPYIAWSEPYDTIGEVKSGQYELGSGTSPTILGEGKYVAMTDNADPMKVVVYRTDNHLAPNQPRVVCQVPVFLYAPGGALSNSLIGYGLSLIAENTYGYLFDWRTHQLRGLSSPGFERIDILPNGEGCRKVWANTEVRSATSARLSTKTGLIYTYSWKPDDETGANVYYWTAMDYRTGETVWEKMAGTGSRSETQFDTWYPGIGIGADGALYVGVYGGLLSIRDTR